MPRAMGAQAERRRKRLIKLIHVARRELGMADESYRMMLANIPALGGKTSSADLSINGLEIVLEQLKAKGFKIKPKRPAPSRSGHSRPLADDSQSRMIRHLWLKLHDLGAVRDPSERAMGTFICRMVKIEALQWLSTDEASRVIEHLKKWHNRVEKCATQEVSSDE
ncbi:MULTISPECIES: gp16 family protein [unclassified Marinimicrobium]|uniref:gp16 family protein n=1 Tax=unclassified Marinimicrobium TaxID=2632100 RepID=UPI00257D2C5F|nr:MULTISPECIES: regulatory protein GemA [unclassified Marinimicrobium]|tara:strand:- start:6 stop:503 length:498 start_codon:yes stop_codon:yes gene_type:complete